MRVFASPGIDSDIALQGIKNSAAGQTTENPLSDPDASAKAYDANSNNPLWDRAVGQLIGNYGATKGKAASSIRVRMRGVSPFGGKAKAFQNVGRQHGNYREKPGGIIDMNPGSSSIISGGPGAAVTLVRLHGTKKANEGQKLPVLPKSSVRGGVLPMPSGGFVNDGASPVIPQVPGFASIVKILANPNAGRK